MNFAQPSERRNIDLTQRGMWLQPFGVGEVKSLNHHTPMWDISTALYLLLNLLFWKSRRCFGVNLFSLSLSSLSSPFSYAPAGRSGKKTV